MKVKGTSNPRHDDCELEGKGANQTGVYAFFCKAHQQWTYVFPVSRTYSYPTETGLDPVTVSLMKDY